jgi:hypothetical protein
MKPATHRHLVVAESWLLLAPTTLLTVAASAFALLFALRGTPSSALVAVNGVLAVLALVATWTASGAYRRHGDDGLLVLWPPVVLAMRAGVLLVGLGVLGVLVERVASPIDTGALGFNVLGALAIVPCVHLLWLRARAIRAQAAPPADGSGRTWPALVVLAVALLALQWLTTGPLPFDRARWDALVGDQEDPWHRRQRMADSLLLDGSLIGRTRAEVVARLGEPHSATSDDGALVYLLGDSREIAGFGSDELWLTLDSQKRVAEANVWNDD